MEENKTEAPFFRLPPMGQGTWYLGETPSRWNQEKEALQEGLRQGLTLIDTAEMYGEGRAEMLVGEAIQEIPRSHYMLTSKVYPHNASRRDIFTSCDNSLHRLGVEYLDLYLLHWRGGVPLAETVECMEELVKRGKIRRWGVSNFDTADMEELWAVPQGRHCAVNQVLYHLGSRGIEYDLLPWLQKHGVSVTGYSPLAQAGMLRRRLLGDPVLQEVAKRNDITLFQLLLAFVLRQEGMSTIPRSSSPQHVRENAKALAVSISAQDWALVDSAYPPPTEKIMLDIV